MATVDIALQADAALVLPTVVLAEFVQRNQCISKLAKTFYAVPALAEGESVRCIRLDGRVFVDHDAVVQTCALVREASAVGPEQFSVRPKF